MCKDAEWWLTHLPLKLPIACGSYECAMVLFRNIISLENRCMRGAKPAPGPEGRDAHGTFQRRWV